MEWTTDAFLNRLYIDTGRSRIENLERFWTKEERREGLRVCLKKALGEFPDKKYPLNSVVLKRLEYEDFILEKVAYTTMEAVYVPVLVLIPKEGHGPWPAVLACHGHGNGQIDAAGLDQEGVELAVPGIHNRFAVQLVKKGMVVIVPEIMGFGVRRMAEELKVNPNYSSCGTLSSQLLAYGRTLAGIRVYEAMRALDYIETRSDVIPGAIGTFGFSGGGLISSFVSGLDERIKATVLCGWTNTFQGSILAMHHCIDNYLPGLLLDSEQPELTGMVAPRALFVESGEQDPIFPVEHVRKAVIHLQETYATWEAGEQFGFDIHPGGHEISGVKSVNWLHHKLGEG
ncbi:dienelactone hydrolase family protein [Paenibacillus sp. sgz500992]|uniref:dienelactone hydrolase family protein n=1 Tax=Paenibacillus sp. sgz500992 TaxID=3242476 RepID=UPI0036D3E1E2